jgi:hypothetical protein
VDVSDSNRETHFNCQSFKPLARDTSWEIRA